MTVIRSASLATRSIAGALLALLLTLRLLSPAGFMPSFEHGAVTIVACPDAGSPSAPNTHHHGGSRAQYQHCPYAAGAAGGMLAPLFGLVAAVVLFGPTPVLGRTLRFVEHYRAHDRPPLRAPPLPA